MLPDSAKAFFKMSKIRFSGFSVFFALSENSGIGRSDSNVFFSHSVEFSILLNNLIWNERGSKVNPHDPVAAQLYRDLEPTIGEEWRENNPKLDLVMALEHFFLKPRAYFCVRPQISFHLMLR